MTVDKLRVAAGQFVATADLDQNLASCLRLIDGAVEQGADLVVLPEFSNHISVYASAEHCRSVAVELDGPWLGAIAERALDHGIHVAITVTVPRDAQRTTVTSVLFDATGEIVATGDKQTLMGNERSFLSGGACSNPVAETVFGPVGIYACMDGVTFETPRTYAVRGARLLLNGLNSFALDEAALHIPVRAVENGVFVVAANKVGALLPADQVENFSAALGVPAAALDGAGESQVVAPDGTILAMAGRTGEEVVVADIDLSTVKPLGARFGGRRPEIYRPLAEPHSAVPRALPTGAVAVACVPGALDDPALVAAATQGAATLVILPELAPPPAEIAADVWVVTSALVGDQHVGQVWTADGLVHSQAQLHHSPRHPTASGLGSEVGVLATPWGDLVVIVGDDYQYPETFRLAAIQGAHVAAVCYQPTHGWETTLAMRERAAENRMCIAACAPTGDLAATMVLSPPLDSLWSPERAQPYDGSINTPDATVAAADSATLVGVIYPDRASNREISRNTDLVGGRPWQASKVLAQ